MGPAKWSCFYLYVIIDIFSRRIVAWCIADAESATLFKPLFDDAIVKHNVAPGQLTVHRPSACGSALAIARCRRPS